MIYRTVQVIEVGGHEAVASMTVADLLEVAIPASAFLPNARLNPIEQRNVERMRHLHDLVQRDFAGEKKRNAQGALADYIRDEWLRPGNGRPASGFMPAFLVFFENKLSIENGTATITNKGMFGDGESRGEGFLVNVQRLSEEEVAKLLSKPVAVHMVHGIDDPQVLAKYFADVNGKGVGVNPNLGIMRDYTDPYAEIAKRVFEKLGLNLETQRRQVGSRSTAVLTGLQARLMVAAMVKGVGAVQYGAKPIPREGVNIGRLETVAEDWVKRVFGTFEPARFREKGYILRSVPVIASLAALGRAFYAGEASGQRLALEVLSDRRIDWKTGKHWTGLAGKVNSATGQFAVGGGKEYAHATWRALTEKDSDSWNQIRHMNSSGAGKR